MDELVTELADALDWDISSITLETPLDSIQWDSMAMLTLIAMARVRGIAITGEKIRAMKTVGDAVRALQEGA
jgi:acyl carrier protein